jgi:hypothetical protein
MLRIAAIAGASVVGLLVVIAMALRGGEQALGGPYLGSYTATVTSAQAAAGGDPRLAGRFTLVLRRNGTYTDSNPLDGRDDGRLAVPAQGRLRFYDDRGCKVGGLERPRGGIYRWSLNGRRLILHLVNEGACSGRTDTLTFPIWVRR